MVVRRDYVCVCRFVKIDMLNNIESLLGYSYCIRDTKYSTLENRDMISDV